MTAPLTTLVPAVELDDRGDGGRRTIGGFTLRNAADALGAGVSSLCLTVLLFGRFTPLAGPFGFVIVALGLFLVLHAVLISLDESMPVVLDRTMAVMMTACAALAGVAVTSVVVFTLYRGRTALLRSNLYVEDMSSAGPADPLSVGGIGHALVGTMVIITIALAITIPLGLGCAVFLNETGSRARTLVRIVVEAMTALPSILSGLFIFATWILILGFERSGLAAALSVSIMMLPIIIRSSDVVLRLVAGNLREAAAALGAPTWRTVAHVVLPTARSGLTTSVILGVARGLGETAPVLLTAGFTSTLNANPLEGPMVSLPLATFEFVRSPQPALIARGFATAAVLMGLVLVLFALARIVGGRPAGSTTKRQAARRAAQSASDLVRIEAREPRS